ncbi:MAG: tetratricopeptide repeat protein, partial [Clostridiales Family XIII bacterium]|nr:tetratricopeptide repeat protein [Clostridiales Family XIII bacterium]
MGKRTYFISYTNRTADNIAWAKWTEWVFRTQLGGKTIMQEYDFPVGSNFRERMHEALKQADCVVCVLTREYMESFNCTEEWTNADEILPIRFDDCKPEGLLKSRVYIDLYGLDKKSARERLVAAVKGSRRPDEEPDAPFAVPEDDASEPDFPVPAAAGHNLPRRNPHFTGRDDILAGIHAGMQKEQVVIVDGFGGFGKTQIAVEYAYRHASEYRLIWCFNAESETQLATDYRAFLERNRVCPDATKLPFDETIKLFLAYFEREDSYLLIYDNAEGCPDLKRYLPQGRNRGHILINARERLAGIVGKKIPVEVFSGEDAVAFLLRRIPGAGANEAKELADELGGLPLALECAAAYIEEHSYTLPGYVALYRECSLRALSLPPTATEYEKTILTVWTATFEALQEKADKDEQMMASVQLLRLCTYCAPEDIPLKLFVDGSAEVPPPLRDVLASGDRVAHDEVIYNLVRHSLVSLRRRVDGSALLSMHRLIQEAASYDFKENAEWVGCCLRVADAVLDYEYGTIEEFDEFSLNLPHMVEIARHAEEYLPDDESQMKLSRLHNEMGFGLYEKGDYGKALELYDKALAIREKVLGKEHPVTAAIYGHIADVYHEQGEYGKALEWHGKALAIKEKVLGKEHPDTAATYNNIALVYHAQGDYGKALEWLGKALAIKEKVLGKEHPATATTFNNIAGVYRDQGDYDKALEWLGKALAIREKVLGTEHPRTA